MVRKLTLLKTWSLMADLDALVPSTGQLLSTRHATAESILATWNSLALLVTSMAEFRGEQHAGRTLLSRVTIVQDFMSTGMSPGAGLIACRSLGSTRYWWVDCGSATFTRQFLKAAPIAGITMSWMAGLVALVLPTAQGVRAGLWADMINVNAAFLIAFVLSAIAFLRATTFASGIISSGCQLPALHHLLHMATSALGCSGFGTGRTWSLMTLGCTQMGISGSATLKTFGTDLSAQLNRIEASFSLTKNLFATWAGFYDIRRQFALPTVSRVAEILAFVIATFEISSTNFPTFVLGDFIVLLGANHHFLVFSAVAFMLSGLLTLWAGVHMASFTAFMLPTQESLLTNCSTLNLHNLMTLKCSHLFATSTALLHGCLTRWTRTRMAEQGTGMWTSLSTTTNIPTAMCYITSIVLRILLLSAEAQVILGNRSGNILTSWTSPSCVTLGTSCPLYNAIEMEDVIAIATGPN